MRGVGKVEKRWFGLEKRSLKRGGSEISGGNRKGVKESGEGKRKKRKGGEEKELLRVEEEFEMRSGRGKGRRVRVDKKRRGGESVEKKGKGEKDMRRARG